MQQPSATTLTTWGKATGPAASATLCSVTFNSSPAQGCLYRIRYAAYIDGTTAAATDDDNMRWSWANSSGQAGNGQFLVPAGGVSPTPYELWVVQPPFPGGGNLFFAAIGVIATATATAIYHASMNVTQFEL